LLVVRDHYSGAALLLCQLIGATAATCIHLFNNKLLSPAAVSVLWPCEAISLYQSIVTCCEGLLFQSNSFVVPRVSTTKDSPLVKELYALLVDQQAMPEDKPAQVWGAFASKGYDEIDTSCFHNAWNKAKTMFMAGTPPPDIGMTKYI